MSTHDTPTQVRVFITHSSLDAPLADALVAAVQLGTGLRHDQVFCSSIEGMDVEDGDDFIEVIKTQLNQATLVIPLITPAYLDSIFCMWELGAIWAMDLKTIAVRVEPVAPRDLPDLLRHRQVRPLGHASLIALSKSIANQTGEQPNEVVWAKERTKFLDAIPSILAELRVAWSSSPAAKLRANARVGEITETLVDAMERTREAGYFALTGSGDHYNRTFKMSLREAAREMARVFRTVSGHQVRVTLKQLIRIGVGEGVSGLGVEDLVRDNANAVYAGIDKVSDNTDFESIVVRERDYFFCNDLTALAAEGKYKNSHVPEGDPIPYESTIVWPIRQVQHGDDNLGIEMTDNAHDLVGFLCVDAKEPGAFSQHEVDLGSVLAAALYFPLRIYLFDEYEDEDVGD